MLDDELMYQLVNVVASHSNLSIIQSMLEGGARYLCRSPQPLLLVLIHHMYRVAVNVRELLRVLSYIQE